MDGWGGQGCWVWGLNGRVCMSTATWLFAAGPSGGRSGSAGSSGP